MSKTEVLDPKARRALEALADNGMLSKEAADKYGVFSVEYLEWLVEWDGSKNTKEKTQ